MERTERLFDKSSKIKDFEACVLSCVESGNRKYAVILDKTAFFPNEGGQACDHGKIGEASIISVDEHDGVITHTVDRELSVGENITCSLDFPERFKKMQDHTAEHIVSGLIHSLFGYDNVGFHLGDGYMTADFSGELTEQDIEKVEAMANDAVFSCRDVRAYYPAPDTLKALEYRSKLDITENVRIVEIDGIDKCACCAPHVENTGEVGLIKITDAIRYKGGMRLTMLAGYDALSDYRDRCRQIKHISMAISAKQSEVDIGVDNLIGELGRLKGKLGALSRELIQKKLDMLEYTEGSVILFENTDDMLAIRNFVNEGVKLCGRIFAVFVPDTEGYKYVIASESVDLKKISQKINESLRGRGGGSARMIQGSCLAEKEEIKSIIGAL